MMGFLLSALRVMPFAKQYHLCSSKDFREAAVELIITTIFSSMPLWLSPVLGPLILKSEASYAEHIVSTISSGELLVYCAALVGPLTYIITRRYGETHSRETGSDRSTRVNQFGFSIAFPHGASFMFFSAMICIISGFSFSMMKNPAVSNDVAKLNLDGIFWTSIILYIFSLYCLFWASAYRNAIAPFIGGDGDGDSAKQEATREEDDFAQQWEQRHAG